MQDKIERILIEHGLRFKPTETTIVYTIRKISDSSTSTSFRTLTSVNYWDMPSNMVDLILQEFAVSEPTGQWEYSLTGPPIHDANGLFEVKWDFSHPSFTLPSQYLGWPPSHSTDTTYEEAAPYLPAGNLVIENNITNFRYDSDRTGTLSSKDNNTVLSVGNTMDAVILEAIAQPAPVVWSGRDMSVNYTLNSLENLWQSLTPYNTLVLHVEYGSVAHPTATIEAWVSDERTLSEFDMLFTDTSSGSGEVYDINFKINIKDFKRT